MVDIGLTDAELTDLALAADPDAPLDVNAVPLDLYPERRGGLLPLWYMPPVMAGATKRWRTPIVLALIFSFLLIDALGLCFTYGQVVGA